MKFLRHSIAATLLAALAQPVPGQADSPFDAPYQRLVGFGDSLSDPGNLYALTGLQATAPYAPIPGAPYEIGDNHFSNGPTWIEQLAEALNGPLHAEPAFLRGRPFSNYAAGGARARSAGASPDLTTQVSAFLSHNRGQDLRQSLIAIQIGGNDVRDALLAFAGGDIGTGLAIPGAAIEAMALNIQALHAAGARDFLVVSVPNLAMTPAVQLSGEPAISTAVFLSSSYNAALNAMLDGLEATLPGISFRRLDIATMLTRVALNPGDYGLTNVVTPCLSFGVVEGAVCDNPDEHLYWDAIHPTTAVHGILARAALGLVAASLPPGRRWRDGP